MNISGDNTYIVGSAQTGKTTLLQTILCGLIGKYTPEQVNLYIIDCAGMLLRIFEDSAQIGAWCWQERRRNAGTCLNC